MSERDRARRPAGPAGTAAEYGSQWDTDRLVELVAGALPAVDALAVEDATLRRAQERFLEWRARELARADRRGGGEIAGALASARVAARAALRIQVAALAVRHRVRCIEGRPRAARVRGNVVAESVAPSYDLAVAAGAGRELWDQDCDGWLELPADVPAGRYVALKVRGDSMEPLMHDGDTVLVERGGEAGAELVVDRLIVARRPDEGYVVKSVGRVNRETVELRSLNPAYAPVSIPRDGRLIVGTVVMRWCMHA
jgi:SOS-response transcriptional repressor LexA